MIKTTLSVLPILLLLSCSIKEDRDNCPCRLSIYPDSRLDGIEYKRMPNTFHIADKRTGAGYFEGNIEPDDFTGSKPYEIRIPKSSVMLSSVFGMRRMRSEGKVLRIEEGRQADSVFVYQSTIDCTSEKAADTLQLAKQWCTIRISFNYEESADVCKCEFLGEWNGFMTNTLEAVKGSFHFDAEAVGKDSYMARVPRQGDDSLILSVTYGENGFQRQYPIGEYIQEVNYNWSKSDLDDIVILIERARVQVFIVTEGWEKGHDYGEIEI